MLFQALKSPDRTKTQLAYMAQYYPWRELNKAAEGLIVWRRRLMMRKRDLLAAMNPDLDTFYLTSTHKATPFKIVWEYNNIPTELEWGRKTPEFILKVDLRIVNGIGAIALLSFNNN